MFCVILSMFLMFCQISGSCFYKIAHCKAIFLKKISLAVSLIRDKLQVISAETEKYLFCTQKIFFFEILSLDVFLPFRIRFIVSMRYFENTNTSLSS